MYHIIIIIIIIIILLAVFRLWGVMLQHWVIIFVTCTTEFPLGGPSNLEQRSFRIVRMIGELLYVRLIVYSKWPRQDLIGYSWGVSPRCSLLYPRPVLGGLWWDRFFSQ
jgi:hypothetical protein